MLKNTAYLVFGAMIRALDATDPDTGDHHRLEDECTGIVETMIRELHDVLDPIVTTVQAGLPTDHRDLLHHEYDRWTGNRSWQLINAGDPCGT
ncbi:hypothetical protein [Saccharothrix sp. ALI-22-I]|uniref:hypothetical protein n=1 Tax=Saccharothrix sp. ALI-22-I TaxID=1933778 RepID=UPI001EE73055|nr:hypothetical protein [Saccharothrix sp. ALI-22-I]